MTKFRFFAVAFLLALVFSVNAQTTRAEKIKRADEVMKKVHQMYLLNQLLPILMSKDQIKQLLPSIEKARDEARKQEELEYKYIVGLEQKVDEALKDAYASNKIASGNTVNQVTVTTKMLNLKRRAVVDENTNNVYATFLSILDLGQKKSAQNTFDPRLFGLDDDPENMTEEARLKLFVRVVLLDPMAYDVLLKLSK